MKNKYTLIKILMLTNFLIHIFLISFAFSSYLPMSYKKHNFGDNICSYFDYQDQIDYVRPCDAGQYCQDTEDNNRLGAASMHSLHTCQKFIEIPPNPSVALKDIGHKCEESTECISGLTCYKIGTETEKKCILECTSDKKIILLMEICGT